MTLPITISEAERNFPKLSIIQNKFRSTMLQDRLNYLQILSIENDITKSTSYDKKIWEYAAKKQEKKYYRGVSGSSLINILCFSDCTSQYRLVSITNLMHNSFILQQYVCYIIILDMFRAVPCSSSGGQIVLLQHLVSSLSVNGCSQPTYCTAVYRQ